MPPLVLTPFRSISLPIATPACGWYNSTMTFNAISAVECLVEDYGWDAVLDALLEMAATAPDERLEEVEYILDAAIAVNERKGQLFVL